MTDDVARSRQAAVDRRLRERDELASIIADGQPISMSCEDIADAVLAAGWRAPRPIQFGRWYRTLLPDGSLWAETSVPTEGYLAHTDPTVPLTWQRITTDGDWVDWPDHPTGLVHPATLDDDDD